MYKKMAKAMKGKAVFTKVDVNFARDISGAQQIRSMPTFQFYSMGKKKHQFSGGDPNQLQQWAQNLATDAEKYNVQLTKDNLIAFYKENAPDKIDEAKIDELLAKAGEGGGPGHYKLVKKLNKKCARARRRPCLLRAPCFRSERMCWGGREEGPRSAVPALLHARTRNAQRTTRVYTHTHACTRTHTRTRAHTHTHRARPPSTSLTTARVFSLAPLAPSAGTARSPSCCRMKT